MPQSSSLDQLCGELKVTAVASFKGAHIHRQDTGQFDKEATVFLVEDGNGARSVLKTKNFNDGEVEKTEWMGARLSRSAIWTVPTVMDSRPNDYIRSSFLSGRPVGLEDVWNRKDLMDSVMLGLNEVDQRINRPPLRPKTIEKGREWVWDKLTKAWIEPVLADPELTRDGLITPDFIDNIQTYARKHAAQLGDIRRAWCDPNGDHILELRDDFKSSKLVTLGMVDIDLQPRPRHYMPMRFLAWSLLQIGSRVPVDSETWVRQMRDKYKLGEEMDPTFALSLTGVLYDLATGERNNPDKRIIALSVKDIINSIIQGGSKK